MLPQPHSSSQSSQLGIPLDHAPSPNGTGVGAGGPGYKLLELAPELLALLESANPPTLRLESTPTAGLLRNPQDNRTWSLRQKNTSNALILLQSTEARSLDAVATVHETIELVPEAENAAAPTVAAKGKWHERFGKTR